MKELILPSKIDSINELQRFVEEVVESYPEYNCYFANILTVVSEAVNNAILHGNRQEPNRNVTLQCKNIGASIEFTISDEGTGFDYENLPDPTLPENIEKLEGRGVFLIQQLADGVRFENNGSTVIITFQK